MKYLDETGKYLNKKTKDIFKTNFRIFLWKKKKEARDIADELGMKISTFNMRFNKDRNIKMEFAEDIADVLSINVEHLFVEIPLYNLNLKKEDEKAVKDLYLKPEVIEFLEEENVTDFLNKEENRKDLLSLINYKQGAEEFKLKKEKGYKVEKEPEGYKVEKTIEKELLGYKVQKEHLQSEIYNIRIQDIKDRGEVFFLSMVNYDRDKGDNIVENILKRKELDKGKIPKKKLVELIKSVI